MWKERWKRKSKPTQKRPPAPEGSNPNYNHSYWQCLKCKEENVINRTGLTKQEQKILDNIVDCYHEFLKLERQHPNEIEEFSNAIHKIQNVLAMRVIRREYPIGWPIKK